MGQCPSDQVWRLSPIQLELREKRSVSAGPDGSVPRVVNLTMEEGFPAPKLLTAIMYTSYSVPHLQCSHIRNYTESKHFAAIILLTLGFQCISF